MPHRRTALELLEHQLVEHLLNQTHILILHNLYVVVIVPVVHRNAAALLASVLKRVQAVIGQPGYIQIISIVVNAKHTAFLMQGIRAENFLLFHRYTSAFFWEHMLHAVAGGRPGLSPFSAAFLSFMPLKFHKEV